MFYSHMQLCMVSFNFPELPFFRVTIRENLYGNGKPIILECRESWALNKKKVFFYSRIFVGATPTEV